MRKPSSGHGVFLPLGSQASINKTTRTSTWYRRVPPPVYLQVLTYGFVDVLAYRRVPRLRKESIEFWMKVPQMMVSKLSIVRHLREGLADVLAPRAFVSLQFCSAIRTACYLCGVVCTEVDWVFATLVFAWWPWSLILLEISRNRIGRSGNHHPVASSLGILLLLCAASLLTSPRGSVSSELAPPR